MAITFEVTTDELEVAFKRMKYDRPRRCFVNFPYLVNFAESQKKIWCEDIAAKIKTGFSPHPTKMCWVPKAGNLVRPGNILHFKDEIIYNIIVGSTTVPLKLPT